MIQKSNNGEFLILNSLLFVWFLELVFPPITVFGNSTLICALCMLGWLSFSYLFNIDFYRSLGLARGSLLIFLVLSVFVPYFVGASTFGNRYISLSLISVGPIIFDYYKFHDNLKDLKKIVICMIPFMAVTFFVTFTRLTANPFISRSIKSSGEYSASLARQGIGGYSFIYLIVPMCVILLYGFFKTKKIILKWSALIAFILSLRLIILSNYFTALLVAIISSTVLIYTYFSQSGTVNRLLLFVGVIVGLVIFFNLDKIILAIEDYIPTRIAKAIVPEENESVFKSVLDEFLNDRWPSMRHSMQSLVESPIVGLLGSNDAESGGTFNSNFGQHSHILDTFAIMGGLLGLLNLYVVFAPFKDIKNQWINYGKSLNIAMMVCLVGIYLFNNATSSIAWVFSIVYPLVRDHYNTENQK